MPDAYQLSLDEVAVCIQLQSGDDAARSFLRSTMGQMSDDNAAGRLAAGSHALLARDALTVDPATGAAALHPDLATMVAVMDRSDWTLRCSIVAGGLPADTTYFRAGALTVEFAVRLGVVARMELVAPPGDVPRRAAAFARAAHTGAPDGALGHVSAAMLQSLRGLGRTPQAGASAAVDALRARLRAGLEDDVARALAHDMVRGAGDWGAVMKLDARPDGSVTSDRGFFFCDAGPRVWLFDLTSSPDSATVFAGHPRAAEALVARLGG